MGDNTFLHFPFKTKSRDVAWTMFELSPLVSASQVGGIIAVCLCAQLLDIEVLTCNPGYLAD